MPALVPIAYSSLMATSRKADQSSGLPPTWLVDPKPARKARGGKSGRARSHRGGGSVYQRADGLFVAQVRYQGKVRRAYARDWESAGEKLRELRATVGRAQPREAQTVAEFIEAWLYHEEHQGDRMRQLRPTTIRGYRQLLRDYVVPAIGHRDIIGPWSRSDFSFLSDRLLPGETRGFRSRKTLHNLRAVTRRLFSQAVAWDRLDSHPVKKDWWPSGYRPASGGTTLTAEQAGHLIETAMRTSPTVGPIISLLLYTGARLGEVLAIRWGAVDLSPPASLLIRETLTRNLGKGMAFGSPKTDKSRRRIWLNEEAAQVVGNLPSREGASGDTLLFPSPYKPRDAEGNERPYGWQMPIHPSYVYQTLQAVLREAGLPRVRVHDLRHTAASLMLASGIETVTVSAVLGHKTPSITHDMYSHVLPGRDREAVGVLTFGGIGGSIETSTSVSTRHTRSGARHTP